MMNALGRPRRPGRRPSLRPDALEGRLLLTAYGDPGPVFDLGATASVEFRSATDRTGRETAVWSDGDGSGLGVYARRFDNVGQPIGPAFLVNAETAGDQVSPRVDVTPQGLTIVAWWSDSRLYYRWYDQQGAPAGDARPLMGTLGMPRDFQLVAGAQAEAFTIYAPGFQVRRYGLDGTPLSSITLDAAPDEGWTTVESTSAAPAYTRFNGDTIVAWTQYKPRQVGGATTYDVQVMVTLVDHNRLEVKTLSASYETGVPDLGRVKEMAPRVDPVGNLIFWKSWAGGSPAAGVAELIPGRYTFFQTQVAGIRLGGPDDGEPRAISYLNNGLVAVLFVRQDASGPVGSIRTWGRSRDDVLEPSTWTEGPTILAPGVDPGSFRPSSLQPTQEGDFWLVRVEPSGGVVAQRYGVDEASHVRAQPTLVSESAGRVLVRVYRAGDLSQPVSFEYTTADPVSASDSPVATPGVDYTATSGVVRLAAGQSETTVAIPILDNDSVDGRRYFRFESIGLDTANASVAIVDDDVDGSPRDLTFVDAGPDGLWAYRGPDDAGRRLSDLDPVRILATPRGLLLADFGPEGLWTWDEAAGWRRINDVSPESMIYGAGRVFLDYGRYGLWSWAEDRSWAFLNHVDPQTMTADDRALFVDFTRGGLWAWTPDGGYRAISLDNPHVEGMASYGGVAYLDYGPSGLWSWGLDAGWSHINAADPDDLAVAADSLYVDYGVFGLWRWTAEGGMTLLTDADARSMAVVAGDLLVGFYGAGLWQWTRADGWAKIWHFSPSLMASTLDGPAAAGFSQSGVALWSPASGLRWLQARAVPQALART